MSGVERKRGVFSEGGDSAGGLLNLGAIRDMGDRAAGQYPLGALQKGAPVLRGGGGENVALENNTSADHHAPRTAGPHKSQPIKLLKQLPLSRVKVG